MHPVHKKIPGDLPPLSKKENQGYIGDLGEKQQFELLDLLERQNRILHNKAFVAKLPDKGEKIINFRDKILKELNLRNKINEAANLISRLNIASEGKEAMSKLEWTGQYSESKPTNIVELDSDDEDDPLKILAQPTGTGMHKKKIINIKPEEPLIKPEDIEEIKSSFKLDTELETEHVKLIIDKVENSNSQKKQPFKPYKTTRSNVHDPEKEKQRKYSINWEVTAATPPLTVHGAAKILSLAESIQLQKEQDEKLKEVQIKHAVERLGTQLNLPKIGVIPDITGEYRLQNQEESDNSLNNSDNDEDHEVHDEEENDTKGTVVYTVDT